MGELSVGEIVFVSFPFSDLSNVKLRPAIIVGSSEKGDWVLCQITSKNYQDVNSILITKEDFKEGGLTINSYIRPRKVFTAHQSLIKKQAGILNNKLHAQVITEIEKMLHE